MRLVWFLALVAAVAALLLLPFMFVARCEPYAVNAFACTSHPVLGALLAFGGLMVATLAVRAISGRSFRR